MVQRTWYSSKDDQTLITTLVEQARCGNQSENGFKSQAYVAVVTTLVGSEVKSGGKAKNQQSVQDRFFVLKKEFFIVKGLRGQSGFGWDEEKCLVMAPQDVWDQYIEAHPEAKKWRKNPFPLYNDICLLVDGTAVTGEGAYHPGEDEVAGQPGDTQDSALSRSRSPSGSPSTPSGKCGALPLPSATPSQRLHKRNGKVTTADSLEQLTRTVGNIKDALAEPVHAGFDSPSSPKRRKDAITALAADENVGLTPHRKVKLIKHIHKNTAVANTYMALDGNDELRAGYLLEELKEISGA